MSGALPADLLERLCRLAGTLPEGITGELAAAIRKTGASADYEEVVNRALPHLLPDNREILSEFALAWKRSAINASGAEVAAALEAASFQERRLRELSSVELVWTGPSTLSAGLRSTEQVILDMISRAKRSIYLVTFAAYRVNAIVAALRDAISREVRVALVLEDKDESEGKVNFNALTSLAGGDLRALKVYVWPLEQRKRNAPGQHG